MFFWSFTFHASSLQRKSHDKFVIKCKNTLFTGKNIFRVFLAVAQTIFLQGLINPILHFKTTQPISFAIDRANKREKKNGS